MSTDTRNVQLSSGLGADELAVEMVVELPDRPLMRHHRIRRFHRVHHFNSFGFGHVSNANFTSQTIFNPQVAVGFGHGGSITQVGGNTNFNSNVQFGF